MNGAVDKLFVLCGSFLESIYTDTDAAIQIRRLFLLWFKKSKTAFRYASVDLFACNDCLVLACFSCVHSNRREMKQRPFTFIFQCRPGLEIKKNISLSLRTIYK